MAKRRHLSRRLALQVLYANRFLPDDPHVLVQNLIDAGEVSAKNWTSFARDLARFGLEQAESLDTAIGEALEHWRIERLSKVDHLILRLALCEMRSFPDIPLRVTINEYIELAKEFGTEDSSAFVNGILDRLGAEFAHKDFQKQGES
ncbi:MAG TPA: transcription antitermination factor NusB [Sumerlaeia bacterium]|nr:transcription antitermination factor NusB [Sumerlaeia bacterium]